MKWISISFSGLLNIGAAAGDADESENSKRNVNQADYSKVIIFKLRVY